MPSKTKREGYLLIDHRNSPGVDEGFFKSSGKTLPFAPGGKTYESATITCAHCNVVVILNPNRTRPRGYCRGCDQYVCDNHGCNQECTSFIRGIEQRQEQIFRVESGYNMLTNKGNRNG